MLHVILPDFGDKEFNILENIQRELFRLDITEKKEALSRPEIGQKYGLDEPEYQKCINILFQPEAVDNSLHAAYKFIRTPIPMFFQPRYNYVSAHKHDFFECKYVLSGSATLLFDGADLPLQTGDFCFIPPETEHSVLLLKDDIRLLIIRIEKKYFSSLCGGLSIGSPISQFCEQAFQEKHSSVLLCRCGEDPTLPALLRIPYNSIIRENERGPEKSTGNDYYEAFIISCFQQLFLYLLHAHAEHFSTKAPDETEECLMPIFNYIYSHMQDISFEKMASEFGYSTTYFSRLIKRRCGHTYSDILHGMRFDRATVLLRESDLSVEEIMREVGYRGKTNFYRAFFEKYRKTPSQYRQDMNNTEKAEQL
ncbi:MAG: AraC family transcriptional regulator [Clostridiales bacterium]|nr:AraC family transcriptional regulator [Clostridiales bacterium]